MKRRLLSIIIMFSAVLFPLLLLHKSNYGFYFDWYNHLWLIGYFGEYFRQHMEMPTVINSIQYVNVTYNIFYGYLFYPLVGLFSSFLGANLAVRFFALILYLIQYIAVFSLIKRISNNHWVGMAIACLSVWAVYPLTNLYNRSALTEIFAVTCLTIALCLWIHSLFVSDLFQKISMRICFATALVMAMGFHPITALYGGSFISIVIIATIPYIIKQKKYTSDIFSGIGIILFIVAVVFPWFYATTGHMEGGTVNKL
ncbi:MAG: hypothetical protein M1365_09625, partial [Actinobacteria bacterium]|nr:hypothetical protein [Actinomycetota bacterium]